MKYLLKSTKLKEMLINRAIGQIEISTLKELKIELITLLSSHLKHRRCHFIDAMGVTNLYISHRKKGFYVLSTSSMYYANPKGGFNYYAGKLNKEWVKNIRDLFTIYDDIADKLFALDFKFQTKF